MFHPVVTALLAVAFAMIRVWAADATTISSDLYLSQFCIGCTSLVYDTVGRDLDRPINIETKTPDLMTCRYYTEFYCRSLENDLSAEAEIEIIRSIDAQITLETTDLENSAGYRDDHQQNSGCTYFERILRDPRRVRDECDNIEPSFDNLEAFGVLTITIVSVISFALFAGGWLLLRFFRNWQLRNMILREKTISNPQDS